MAKKKNRIAALKEKFKKEQNDKTNKSTYSGDMYPFWQMEDGESATVRILPDANEDNDNLFFVDKLYYKISLNGEDVTIPSPLMYGDPCPISELSKSYYSDGDEDQGKYYYRKKTSMVRVLIISDPLPADEETGETREGKVMNTQFGWQLMEKIKHSIINDFDDDDAYPWDLENGINFVISKTKNGKYSRYDMASGFERKSTSVEDLIEDFDDLESVDDIELIDLSTLLPKCRDYDELENILQAHINGDEYDLTGKGRDKDDDEDDEDDGEESKPSKKKKKDKKKKDKKKKDKKKKDKKKKKVVVEEDDDDDDEYDGEDEDQDDDEDEEDEDDISAILDSVKRKRKKDKK